MRDRSKEEIGFQKSVETFSKQVEDEWDCRKPKWKTAHDVDDSYPDKCYEWADHRGQGTLRKASLISRLLMKQPRNQIKDVVNLNIPNS